MTRPRLNSLCKKLACWKTGKISKTHIWLTSAPCITKRTSLKIRKACLWTQSLPATIDPQEWKDPKEILLSNLSRSLLSIAWIKLDVRRSGLKRWVIRDWQNFTLRTCLRRRKNGETQLLSTHAAQIASHSWRANKFRQKKIPICS